MSTTMTTRSAIAKVLTGADGPMKAGAIADKVVPMVPGLKGKTPKATVAAVLYTEAKKSTGIVRKVKAGFVLREAAAGPEPESDNDVSPIAGSTVLRRGGEVKPDPKGGAKKRQSKQPAAA